ncbi:MAG: hypothetical protein JW771_04215, partial [Candidatus Thermoplasmatota archaeon]|nr:hypothetical protein [Candidatus Thermoplasmatota archaeon]
YFFYKGAHCIITADGQSKEFDTPEPFYWLIKNREKHKIENLSDEVLEFQAIYAPGFVMGEVEYVR